MTRSSWTRVVVMIVGVCLLHPIQGARKHPDQLPKTCIKGPFHKPEPSRESEDFLECLSWREHSCCTANVSNLIHHHRAIELYNYHWDLCGPLSAKCEKYLKNEECFYQCEPRLMYYQHQADGSEGYILNAPVCKSYCHQWFDACKDDMTCVEDWLGDYNYTGDVNSCPQNAPCRSFAEMYGSAAGLCDKMWGAAFRYQDGDTDCFRMEFDGGQSGTLTGYIPASTGVKGAAAAAQLMALLLLQYLWSGCR